MLDAGEVGTEMLYYLVGSRELDGGLMCTASHNPKRYTGAKLVRRGAIALSGDAGIGEVRAKIEAGLGGAPGGGSVEHVSLYEEFQNAALEFIDPGAVKPMRVVVDGGNGMAGPMVGPLLRGLGLDLIETYWEPDGHFPDHEPNPLLPENREFIMRRGRAAEGADLGIAWDGDADRCFFIDDQGAFVDGDFLTALLAESMLSKAPRRDDPVRRPSEPRGGRRRRARRRPRPDEPRRPRLLQDPHARGGRDVRRRGLRSLLLPRLLLRGLGNDPGAADPRAALDPRRADVGAARAVTGLVTSSRARSTPRSPTRRPRSRSSHPATTTAGSTAWTASRSTTTTGTSTSGRRTPSRCCAYAWSHCARTRTWSVGATRCWQ